MATHSLEYSPVPSVSPARTPNARAQVSTSAETFGGGIAQAEAGLGKALEHAGAETAQTASIFEQVAGDDGLNQFTEGRSKILHGDPSATIVGPDGKPAPDLGYMGLKGAAALDAREATQKKLDDLYKAIHSGLSPMAQRHFESGAKRYLAQTYEQIGSHADSQANTYYSSVNKATSDANLNAISLAPTDEGAVKIATDNLINARVKQAQLQGGTQENIDEAIRSAKQDALKVRVLTISATDPVAARKLLDENRDAAGTDYASLHQHVNSRADQQQGIGVANNLFAKTQKQTGYANPNLPIFAQAAQSVPGAMSPLGLARLVHIESSGNAMAGAGGAHQGLVQASEKWWSQFGRGSRLDPHEAIMAAARATAHDRPILTASLGRNPSDGELYLAHQQGVGGAAALLTHPNMAAADALMLTGAYKSRAAAAAAISGNGGNPNAPASAFTGMWLQKFGGNVDPNAVAGGPPPLRLPAELSGATRQTPPPVEPAPMSKADALREIMNDASLSDQAKSYAMSHYNQLYSAQQVSDAHQERARKEASDAAANAVMETIGKGQATPELIQQIYQSPELDWRVKHQLVEIAQHAAGVENTAAYGPGYADAFRRITAPAGDPEKISDPRELLNMSAPGGTLTVSGYNRLKTVLADTRRSVETSGVNTTKAAMLSYAKQKLVVDEALSFGGKQWKDDQGLLVYNGQFIPKFEAAYDAWVAKGKDPFEFLTQENIDKMVAPMRSRADIARAQLEAGAATGETVKAPPPPAPEHVDEKAWQDVVTKPPRRFTAKTWGGAVAKLVADHSPEAMKEFDDYFGPLRGPKAENVLADLGVKGAE